MLLRYYLYLTQVGAYFDQGQSFEMKIIFVTISLFIVKFLASLFGFIYCRHSLSLISFLQFWQPIFPYLPSSFWR